METIKLKITDKFLLKAFPRLVFLSIALDPLKDKILGADETILSTIEIIALTVLFILEYKRKRQLCKIYGKTRFNNEIFNTNTEYKYDVAICLFGFAVCWFCHSGAWWFLLAVLVVATIIRFWKPKMA